MLEIQSPSTCALSGFFEDLLIEVRAISNCTQMNRRDTKTKPFFLQDILEFPLVKLGLQPDSECKLSASKSASTREFEKKPWVECKVTFKKLSGSVPENLGKAKHDLFCKCAREAGIP